MSKSVRVFDVNLNVVFRRKSKRSVSRRKSKRSVSQRKSKRSVSRRKSKANKHLHKYPNDDIIMLMFGGGKNILRFFTNGKTNHGHLLNCFTIHKTKEK